MSDIKKYSVTIMIDACTTIEVEAATIEEAVEAAYSEVDISICCHCSRHINIGDHLGTVVHDSERNEVYNDL